MPFKHLTHIFIYRSTCVWNLVNMQYLVGTHWGRSGHIVLFFAALSFSKRQTFLINNNPEGNPLNQCTSLRKLHLHPGLCGLLMAALHIFLFPHFHNKCITTNLRIVPNNQELREIIVMAILH